MATFQDSLKSIFFGTGANKLTRSSRVCLLDASGAAAGSDDIDRISAMMFTDDDMVDMGLPSGTLWCKYNLGATTETASGWYFSWGNLDAHGKGAGYDFSQANYTSPAASIDGNLTLAQDAARANKLGGWMMPSKENFAELFNADYTEFIDANGNVITATDKRTTYNGVVGLLIRSKVNGNTLFFPAAGVYNGTTLGNEGSSAYYRSSSYETSSSAYILHFSSSGVFPQNGNARRLGMTIRPVIHK